jgi:outer membrane protein OmpA-like peptidoglycan-associated protein
MKHLNTKLALLALIVFLGAAINLRAQNSELKWAIGLHASLLEPNTTLGNDFWNFNFGEQNKPALGLSLNKYMTSSFNLGLEGYKGNIAQSDDSSSYNDDLWLINLRLRYKFYNGYFLKEDATVGPFVNVGVGLNMADVHATYVNDGVSTRVSEDDTHLNIYAGAGLRFRLNDYIALDWQTGINLPAYDQYDGDDESTDKILQHSLGLIVNLGTLKDSDEDGVPDRSDKCANTPKGVKVDDNGCPYDSDKDGVADYQDDCPLMAGVVALKGCPDKDGDGVADKDDRCPDQAGVVALGGCPDADNDGVADMDDQCASTPSGVKVDAKGCPVDTDKDGIADHQDECPTQAGPAVLKGCPDGDGDGVADKNDKCPTVKGVVANNGCPEIPKEIYTQITKIASKIFFETGSDKLKASSKTQLSDLVDILNKYPEAKLSIEGHTDDVGDDGKNMELSQKRCESVKSYLTSKGVDASRLTATGYGETMPVADNKTADGRAKNRRVELKTQY